MFVGSFFRVQAKTEMDRVPIGSSATIIYVEDERKFYEKNRYGYYMEYNLEPALPVAVKEKEVETYGEEISDLENRLYELEQMFQQLSKDVGGMIHAI
jgi:hypothetical protein